MVLATSGDSGLTAALKPQLVKIVDSIRAQVTTNSEISARWKSEHQAAVRAQRTAGSWTDWLDDQVTQAAVGWVLGSVFVRFCEDNVLLNSSEGRGAGTSSAGVWITSPDPHRAQLANDAETAFYQQDSDRSYRHWLEHAFGALGAEEATAPLVGSHSAIYLAAPHSDAVAGLLKFWRQTDDDGLLLWRFDDPELSTRFLGDLYQDLSDRAKDKYALLQTPEFVEEFILDRTLEPALAERPLEGFRLIDPTCGSGHFLLGAFHRLLRRWQLDGSVGDLREQVKRSVESVYGVDVNPFAAAIARFRLVIAVVKAMGEPTLTRLPHLRINIAVGDSLLHGPSQYRSADDDQFWQQSGVDIEEADLGTYRTEDPELLRTFLVEEQYDAVVGNPPYIVARDRALNERYRALYSTCKGKYALTVPFMERFFKLAKTGERAGWVGQITSNSFMKREFGSKLIEEFLAKKDLRLIADTAGAYIPGHGTPTVIMVGRNAPRTLSTVRAVLGIRGEPGRPAVAAQGQVWTSIVEHVDQPGHEDEWLSVADLPRATLAAHPWSLSGGAALELAASLEHCAGDVLRDRNHRIGFFGIPGVDDAMIWPARFSRRLGDGVSISRPLIEGDVVRDFTAIPIQDCFFPYSNDHDIIAVQDFTDMFRVLWQNRVVLESRATFSGESYKSAGRAWWSWHQLPKDQKAADFSITFAFVATHNHFVLDRGGKVFKQSAPVIKLPAEATEDDHLRLLGVLNSSTACFWLKQNSHNKGNSVDSAGARTTSVPWDDFYEFTGTTLKDFPLPAADVLPQARRIDGLAQRLSEQLPAEVLEREGFDRGALDRAGDEYGRLRALMIAEQEELDWAVYGLYGLPGGELVYSGELPELNLGERAFEIALARKVAAGSERTEWFTRHGSTSITVLPSHWPADYRDLVALRLDLIADDRFVNLLERPEFKRRWQSKPWSIQLHDALGDHLLTLLESRSLWFDREGRPMAVTVNQLASAVETSDEFTGFRAALDAWVGRADAPVVPTLTALLEAEHVPYLAAHRYKDSGLRKRAEWEQVWDAQRAEDAGTRDVSYDPIPVPPKYSQADFVKQAYWSQRGKLDVPKERFISYPGAARATDQTLMLGWAGWNPAEQGLALARLYGERSADTADPAALTPLLAGIDEQLPWIRQWHSGIDATFGVDLGEYLDGQVETWTAQIEVARADLPRWRPPSPTRGRGRKITAAQGRLTS